MELKLLETALTEILALYPEKTVASEVAVKTALVEVREAVRRAIRAADSASREQEQT